MFQYKLFQTVTKKDLICGDNTYKMIIQRKQMLDSFLSNYDSKSTKSNIYPPPFIQVWIQYFYLHSIILVKIFWRLPTKIFQYTVVNMVIVPTITVVTFFTLKRFVNLTSFLLPLLPISFQLASLPRP